MVKPQRGDSEQIPMSKRPVYRVASAGLDPRDVRLIEIVFRHSQYNRYDFQVLDGLDLTRTDILIANPGDPAGLDALIAVRSFPRPIPSVNAVPRGAQAAARYSITIDRLTLQLLPILNRVVEAEQLVPAAPADEPQARQAVSSSASGAMESQPGRAGSDGAGTDAEASGGPLGQPEPAGEAAGAEPATMAAVEEGVALAAAPIVSASRASEAAASAIAQAAGRAAAASAGSRALAHLANLASSGTVAVHDREWLELVTRAPSPARLRAVIVDPSVAARQQLDRALGRMGLEVHGVDGIGPALQELAERHADIVIAESCLVDGDGFELVKRMRLLAAYRFTPVLLLRSRLQMFDSARARLAREVTLLAKPVRRADLEAIVRDCLRGNAVLDDIEELLSPG